MGKMRFKFWLHKLKDMRIKGFHRSRRSSASFCSESPRSIPRSPYFRHPSPRHAQQVFPAIGFAESGFCLSPVNHKAFDIPFPLSPRRSPLSLSPRPSPRSIGLLNSPVAHSAIFTSPIASATEAANASMGEETPSSVHCGCRAPLASSFRKAKENLQAFSASIRSDDSERYPRRSREGLAEANKATSASSEAWVASSEAWERGVLTAVNDDVLQEMVELRRGAACQRNGLPESVSVLTEANAALGVLQLDLRPSKDANDAKASSNKLVKISEGPNSCGGSFRLSTSSPDAKLDTCLRGWDKEYSSFTSEDNFFTSTNERAQTSQSSNSSCELYERNHRTSFDGNLKDSKGAECSSFDGWPMLYSGTVSQVERNVAANMEYEIGVRPVLFERQIELRVPNPSPEEDYARVKDYSSEPEQGRRSLLHDEVGTDSDQGVFYPWLSHECSGSPLNVVDLEANSKAWTEWLLPTTSDQDATSEKVNDDETTEIPCAYVDEEKRVLLKHSSHSKWRRGSAVKIPRKVSAAVSRRKSHQASSGDSNGEESCFSHSSGSGWSKSIIKFKVSKAKKNNGGSKLSNDLPSRLLGRVSESVAVVKCSRDPYLDFRDSMVDMVLEKQICESPDLEELLQCFLSLNSLEHHDTIVRAFTEVWEKVFGSSARSPLLY